MGAVAGAAGEPSYCPLGECSAAGGAHAIVGGHGDSNAVPNLRDAALLRVGPVGYPGHRQHPRGASWIFWAPLLADDGRGVWV